MKDMENAMQNLLMAAQSYNRAMARRTQAIKNLELAFGTFGRRLYKIRFYPQVRMKFQRTVLITTTILLSLLLLLACGQVVAQKKLPADTLKAIPDPHTGIGFFDKHAEVTVWDNGTIEIKGDSIRAIKMLWDKLRECNKREMELEMRLSKIRDMLDKLVKANSVKQ